ADVKAALSLEAALPLDLFSTDPLSEAGIVALFQAEAEAAAWIRANIALEFVEFRRLLASDGRLSGVWADLTDIFFDQAELSAGIWAKASFSAEVIGRAAVYGTLLPSEGADAGFTVVLDCAAGLTAGAGMGFVHNIGLRDAQQLLNRLSDCCASAIEDELERQLRRVARPEA